MSTTVQPVALAALGSLPLRMKVLYITTPERTGSWLTEAFAAEHDVDLDCSAFYSDSFNDLPLMNRVGTAVAVNPDARLRRYARRRGWRTERWM